MYTIHPRNVCHAYRMGLETLAGDGQWEETRNGRALVLPGPLLTVTERPMERVLFDPVRDANPFFHLYECIWMLAGMSDGTMLDQFISDFSSRYAEDDGTVHGAYGARWRDHWPLDSGTHDQIAEVVRLLRENPQSRQAVITMWDPTLDLTDRPLGDRPCNTQIYLRVREAVDGRVLDLTVTCRSNDAIWGAHGANAVHFSFLQEYLAAAIGVGVGRMYQFSNNYHVYESVLERKVPGWADGDVPSLLDPYTNASAVGVRLLPSPMVTVPDHFVRDCEIFVSSSDHRTTVFGNQWFKDTAWPVLRAHQMFKEGDKSAALQIANEIDASDWSWACRRWIARRMDNV